MSRSGFGAKAGLVVLVLLAGATLLPLAEADHAYSHRYIIYGRVIDANNNPVQGVTVNMGYKDFTPEGACANQPDTETQAYGRTQTIPVTNAWGEFMFCFHTHSLSRALPGTGIVRIDEENYTREFTFDPFYRQQMTVEKLDHVSPRANTTSFDQAYVIQGRIWRPAGNTINVEGIGVFGHTVDNTIVNITFTHDGVTDVFNTSTNNYGDFAYRANVTKRPTTGNVVIESAGESHQFDLTPAEGRTGVHIEAAKTVDPFVRGALYVVGGIVLVAVLAGAGVYGYRKMSARREAEAVRATATRRRANK